MPADGNPFTIYEMGILTTLMERAIQKTPFQGRTLGEIHGEIYTRMRQEMLTYPSTYDEKILDLLKGKFKNLPWRLSNKQKEQMMTLFNNLSRSRGRMHQPKPEDSLYEGPKDSLQIIEMQVAKCASIVNEAKANVKIAQQIAEQITKLDEFLQEG